MGVVAVGVRSEKCLVRLRLKDECDPTAKV